MKNIVSLKFDLKNGTESKKYNNQEDKLFELSQIEDVRKKGQDTTKFLKENDKELSGIINFLKTG